MIKSLLIAFIIALLAYETIQVIGPRVDISGVSYVSTVSGWTCAVSLQSKSNVIKVESLSASNTAVLHPDMDDLDITDDLDDNDNDPVLDTVAWNGTSCNCWIILFDGDGYDGGSLGLWTTNSTQGTYDLSAYNYLDDSDTFNDDDYKQWNGAVESYKIYCF